MIVIIGGGISGLALAYQLEKKGLPYLLLEATGKLGGLISTHKTIDGFQFEGAPNTLLADAEAFELIEELGLSEAVVYPSAVSENRYVFKNGRLRQLPDKPLRLLTSRFFSWATKLKVIKELQLVPPKETNTNETLADFGQRHFGTEIVDYALAPFVLGIYGYQPYQLSVRLTFPHLHEMEAKYGSVIKAFKAAASTTARKKSINFKDGLQTLTDALAKKLNSVLLNAQVTQVNQHQNGSWVIRYQQHGVQQVVEADDVVFACSLKATASIVNDINPELAKEMRAVPHKSMVGIHTVWKKDSHYHFDGFGALNPPVERKITGGSIWVSSIFPDRVPDNCRMLTTFAFISESDAGKIKDSKSPFLNNLISGAIQELREIYNFESTPIWHTIIPWFEVLPQYGTALAKVWDKVGELPDGLHIQANWYNGISLNDSLKKAVLLANTLEKQQEPVS